LHSSDINANKRRSDEQLESGALQYRAARETNAEEASAARLLVQEFDWKHAGWAVDIVVLLVYVTMN